MNITDIIIIGEGILGLYAGIKAIEKGYNVKIFEIGSRPSFVDNFRMIFNDSNHSVRKLFYKLSIQSEVLNIRNDIIETIISKLGKMPTSLQQEITFKQACINTLCKNNIIQLEENIHDIDILYKIDTFTAIQMIQKNYNKNNQNLRPMVSSSIVLKKMREYFKHHNGQIFYNNQVQHIELTPTNTFLCTINNKQWASNIIISTLNPENLLKIYDWTFEQKNNITSSTQVIQEESKYQNILLDKYHICTPCNKNSKKSIYKYSNGHISEIKQILGNGLHLYICHKSFCKNPNWFNSLFEYINDIMKYI